jgi:HEAT repeat protein
VAEEALTAWMEDRSQRVELRRDATRWLGRQRDRRAFLALTRAARGSDERGVRVEAVEAMEDIPFDDVADTLITYVRALPDPAQRNEAIEALGHRTERRVVVFLQRLVDDGADRAIAKRAIESLGDMPEGRGADAVVDVARHHADPGLRRVAAEAVAHLEPTRRALDVLRDVAWTDSDPSVRVEAIEGIGDVHDARSVALLAEIAERHSDVRAQVEATEALAGTAAPDAAIEVLGRLARSHPRAAVQRKAAEALGDFDDARAVELLVALAESHADASVQVEAAEALGSVHPHEPAIAALKRLARTHPNAAVRRRALESLADYAAEGKR